MAKCPPTKRKALDKAVIARWTHTNRLFSLFRLLLDPHANIQRAKESLSFLRGEDAAADATQYILHKFSTLLKKCVAECSRQPLLQTIVGKTKWENHAHGGWAFCLLIYVETSWGKLLFGVPIHIFLYILVRTLLESLMRRVYDARKTFAFYSLPNYHQKKFIDKIFKVLSVPLLDVVFA